MTEAVLDSNVLINFLDDVLSPESRDLVIRIFENRTGFVSQMNVLECLALPSDKIEEIGQMQGLLAGLAVVHITEGIIEEAITICQRFRLKPADSIIAATALALNCPLITNDYEGFHKVEGLVVLRAPRI